MTKRKAEASRRNLENYRKRNPKPALKHGGYTFKSEGSAPPQIIRQLNRFESDLVKQVGEPSPVQRALIQSARRSLGLSLLLENYILQNGVAQNGDIAGAAKLLPAVENALRRTLARLLSDKRPPKTPSLDEIISDISEEEADDLEDDEEDDSDNEEDCE